MKQITWLFFLLIALSTEKINAQLNNTPNPAKAIPPSPNASAIEKFNIIPVSNSTGIPEIAIPLWNWQKGMLNFNLGLRYHAGGVKVDDIASSVGLGWVMTGLGSVNRTVIGLPDDMPARGFIHSAPHPFIVSGSFDPLVFNFTTYPAFLYGQAPPNGLISEYSNPHSGVAEQVENNLIDGEQDMFSFNTPTCNGTFVLDKNGVPVKLEQSNVKIEAVITPGASITSFKVYDENGIVYYFEKTENQTIESFPAAFPPNNLPNNYTSSWHLTKIKSPAGNTEIDITYSYSGNVSAKYHTSFSESRILTRQEYTAQEPQDPYPAFIPLEYNFSYQVLTTTNPLPVSIDFSDGTSVDLEYENDRDDFINGKSLKSIKVKNLKNENAKQFDFIHSYFVNTGTESLMFTSDNNSRKRLRLDEIREVSSADVNDYKATKLFYSTIELNPRGSKNTDIWGYNVNPGRNNQHYIPQMETPYDIKAIFGIGFLEGADRRPDSVYAKAGMLEKIEYPTGGYTEFEFEINKAVCDKDYYIDEFFSNISTWEQNDFNTAQNLVFNDRNVESVFFTFWTKEIDPRLDPDPMANICLSTDNLPCEFQVIRISDNAVVYTLNDLYSAFFEGVTTEVNLPLNASYKLRFVYNVNDPCSFRFPFYVEARARFINQSTEKLVGGVRIKRIKTSSGNEINERLFSYAIPESTTSSGKLSFIPGFSNNRYGLDLSHPRGIYIPCPTTSCFRHIFTQTSSGGNTINYASGGPLNYNFVTETFTDGSSVLKEFADIKLGGTGPHTEDYPFLPIQNYQHINGKVKKETVRDDLGNLKSETTFTYNIDEDYLNPDPNSQEFTDPHDMRNLRVTKWASSVGLLFDLCNYDLKYFTVFPYWYYLTKCELASVETKVYEGNEVMTSTEYYSYFNNRLVHKTVSNSKGEILRETYSYPHTSYPNGNLLQTMMDRNMMNVVTGLTMTKVLNYDVLSEQKNEYALFLTDMPQVAAVQKSILGNALENEIQMNQYDVFGNVLQYTGKDGIVHSFIWAYKGQYPVVHVIGATYATVSDLITNPSVLENPTDGQLDNLFSEIRTGAGSNVQVTTYKYIPLVGVKEITDINGKKMVYEYDGFNRLKVTRDNDNNIIKVHEYEYAP